MPAGGSAQEGLGVGVPALVCQRLPVPTLSRRGLHGGQRQPAPLPQASSRKREAAQGLPWPPFGGGLLCSLQTCVQLLPVPPCGWQGGRHGVAAHGHPEAWSEQQVCTGWACSAPDPSASHPTPSRGTSAGSSPPPPALVSLCARGTAEAVASGFPEDEELMRHHVVTPHLQPLALTTDSPSRSPDQLHAVSRASGVGDPCACPLGCRWVLG